MGTNTIVFGAELAVHTQDAITVLGPTRRLQRVEQRLTAAHLAALGTHTAVRMIQRKERQFYFTAALAPATVSSDHLGLRCNLPTANVKQDPATLTVAPDLDAPLMERPTYGWLGGSDQVRYLPERETLINVPRPEPRFIVERVLVSLGTRRMRAGTFEEWTNEHVAPTRAVNLLLRRPAASAHLELLSALRTDFDDRGNLRERHLGPPSALLYQMAKIALSPQPERVTVQVTVKVSPFPTVASWLSTVSYTSTPAAVVFAAVNKPPLWIAVSVPVIV